MRSPSSDLAAKGQLLTEEWRKNPGSECDRWENVKKFLDVGEGCGCFQK